ncbi:MAG: hypothetical protein WBM50_09405 [Acidimicrobiales bacterium]
MTGRRQQIDRCDPVARPCACRGGRQQSGALHGQRFTGDDPAAFDVGRAFEGQVAGELVGTVSHVSLTETPQRGPNQDVVTGLVGDRYGFGSGSLGIGGSVLFDQHESLDNPGRSEQPGRVNRSVASGVDGEAPAVVDQAR